MNRYTPVPPIKNPSSTNKKQTNNNANNKAKNSNKMDEEKFEQLDDDFSLSGEDLNSVVRELKRRLRRLHQFTDFSIDETKQHFIYVYAACINYCGDFKTGEQLGSQLTSSNYTELFKKIWKKHFGAQLFDSETSNETLLFNMMASLQVLWNVSDKSNELCERILEDELHKDVFGYLSSKVLSPRNLYVLQEIKESLVQGSLGVLHNVLQRARNAREAYRDCKAVDVLQPFREASDFQMISCVALMTQSYLVTEDENEKINSGTEVFELLITLLDCSVRRVSHNGLNFGVIEVLEALNKLAANDSNKQHIVECGALPYYVKIMRTGQTTVEQAEAANGIWTLAFNQKCKDRIVKEDGCIEALRELLEKSGDEKVRKKAEGALWILEEKSKIQVTENSGADKKHEEDGGHVFISYQWDAKPTVLKIRDRLRTAGYKVWIDEDDMSGSVLEAMAMAVEKASVVLVCLSQKYKESPSCRTEAEYTFRLRKPIVPLRLQPGYYPDGWLGALAGSKLVFDCSVLTKYEDSIKNLVKELLAYKKTEQDVVDGIVPSKAPVTNTMQPSHEKSSSVNSWKTEDINQWLVKNNLSSLKNLLKTFDGPTLLEYQSMRLDAPEAFFADLSKDGVSRTDRLRLSRALKDLA